VRHVGAARYAVAVDKIRPGRRTTRNTRRLPDAVLAGWWSEEWMSWVERNVGSCPPTAREFRWLAGGVVGSAPRGERGWLPMNSLPPGVRFLG